MRQGSAKCLKTQKNHNNPQHIAVNFAGQLGITLAPVSLATYER